MRCLPKLFAVNTLAMLLLCAACADTAEGPPLTAALTLVDSVGVLEGPEEFVFGIIEDVRLAADGSIFVLDRQAPALRWYGSDGGYLGGVTATGRGPCELAFPHAIALTAQGHVGVFDPQNGRIMKFRPTADGVPCENISGVVASPYATNRRNLCSIGDRWFMYQQDGDAVIREYIETGEKVRSFGRAVRLDEVEYGVMTPFAEPLMNSGMLLCVEDRSQVLSLPLRSDTVRSYSAEDATLVWATAVEGIHPERYQLNPVPGISGGFEQESEGSHVALSMVRWSDETFLVQYRFWSGTRREPEVTRTESIELRFEDGSEVVRTDQLPVLADIRGETVVTYESDPFPRVLIWSRSK